MNSEDLVKKWLNNELSEEEKQLFNKLDDAQYNEQIIESAKYFRASNFSNIDDFKSFKTNYNGQNIPVRKLYWLNPLLKIASIVIIALGVYFTFFFNHLTQVQTFASEKQSIELPDHSLVTLNALTQVKFDKRNWQDNRKLKLNGEAYFKVTKGKTFDVITDQGVITVVGTQFNVKDRYQYFEVKCFEGIVKVTSDTITRFLKVGDTYQILNGKFTQGKTVAQAPKWTENRSVFDAIPIKEVFAELERQYNIEISYNLDSNRLFTGGFVHDNLENALIAVTHPMNLTYVRSSSNLVVIHEKKN
ncbi:FecR family protein [Gaetbulibacter sp. M235]|uniref:FecR family protein n=1 Tax=Gaetbulibacter sp. M235 TaxID=3126510 RepID=UPI00374F6BD1